MYHWMKATQQHDSDTRQALSTAFAALHASTLRNGMGMTEISRSQSQPHLAASNGRLTHSRTASSPLYHLSSPSPSPPPPSLPSLIDLTLKCRLPFHSLRRLFRVLPLSLPYFDRLCMIEAIRCDSGICEGAAMAIRPCDQNVSWRNVTR